VAWLPRRREGRADQALGSKDDPEDADDGSLLPQG